MPSRKKAKEKHVKSTDSSTDPQINHLAPESKGVRICLPSEQSGATDPLPSFYLRTIEGKSLVSLAQTSCASMCASGVTNQIAGSLRSDHVM